MKYLGICIFTSVCPLPNIRLLWKEGLCFQIVKDTMSRNAFEAIRSMLHFNDNMLETSDKLQKLRPVIDSLSRKFLSIPMEEKLSVDEQICATKARHHLKNYLPLKPHKWGYKLFVLCGVSGFAYKFEIYTGTENNSTNRPPNEPDLGASSNVVVRLASDIPRNCFYKLYFDNYYTSLPLISYLQKIGIHSLGTARRARIPSCKVPDDKELKKVDRGKSGEYVTDYNGTEITNVYWKDNKTVLLLSYFVGEQPTTTVKRFDKKKKEPVEVSFPAIVKQYNVHMGGVDLLDSHIGRYRIKMRSRKWYMWLFYHLLDIAIINSWLLYRRCNEGNKTMSLLDFRIELATTLCSIGVPVPLRRGRPSDVQNNIDAKRKKANTSSIPPQDVRLDKENHFPLWNNTRLRCKNPLCKSQTFVICQKCRIALCFNQNKNCFLVFHNK